MRLRKSTSIVSTSDFAPQAVTHILSQGRAITPKIAFLLPRRMALLCRRQSELKAIAQMEAKILPHLFGDAGDCVVVAGVV